MAKNRKFHDRKFRLQIMVDVDVVEAIETWRFKNRLPSRSAAFRELIRRGLAAEDDPSDKMN